VHEFLSAAHDEALPDDLPPWIKEAAFTVACGETNASYLARGIKDDVGFISTAIKDASYRNKLLSPSYLKHPDYEGVMRTATSKVTWFLSISSKLYSNPLNDSRSVDYRSTMPKYFYTKKRHPNCKELRDRWTDLMQLNCDVFDRCLRIHVCLPDVTQAHSLSGNGQLFVDRFHCSLHHVQEH